MDFLVDFDGPTSTPASSNNHSAFNGGVVHDPFDFDPFSSDPFSTDSYRKQSVDTVANEGRFFDDFDPFGSGLTTASPSSSLAPTTVSTENNQTTSSNLLVVDTPAADAVDIFGMASPVTKNGNGFDVDWTNSNGHVTCDTPNAAFIGNESVVNSSPAAPTTQNDGNGLMTSSLGCGWQDEPPQQADWTSDWSNNRISAASGGVEVVDTVAGDGDDHVSASSKVGYVAQESLVESSAHDLEICGNAVVVNEPSSEPQNLTSSRGCQPQTPTSDSSNGYALTDVIDDMMASEFPEASAPKADIEDELMSPVLPLGSMNGSDVVERHLPTTFVSAPIAVSTSASAADHGGRPEVVTSCSTLDTIVDGVMSTGHQISRPPVLETHQFNFADSTTAALRKVDVVDGDVFIPDNDVTNEQAPVIGDKRLILSGPLQLMGRCELASRPGISGGSEKNGTDNRQVLSPTHAVVDEANLSISMIRDGSLVSADSSTELSDDQSGIDVWNACLKKAVGSDTRKTAEKRTVNGEDILVAKPVINFELADHRKYRRECDMLSADGSLRIIGDVSRVMIDVQLLQSPSSDKAEIRKKSGTSPEACSVADFYEGTACDEGRITGGGPTEHVSDVFNETQSGSAANFYNFDDAFSNIQAQLDAAASGTSTNSISAAIVDKEPETVVAQSVAVDAASEQHFLPVLERVADDVTVQESQNPDRTEQGWKQSVISEASDNINQSADTTQETMDKAAYCPQEPDTGSPFKQPDTVQTENKASYFNFEDEFSKIQAQLNAAAVSGPSSDSASSVAVSTEESMPVKTVVDTSDNQTSLLPNSDVIAESDRKSREIDQYWRHYERDQIIVSDGEKVDLFDEHLEKFTQDQSTLPVSTGDVTFSKTTPADHETEHHQEPQMAASSPDEGRRDFDSFVDDDVQQSSTTTTVRSLTRADEEDQSRRTSVAISDAGSMTADDDSDRNQQQISLSYGYRNDVVLEDQQENISDDDVAEMSVRTLSNKFDSQETHAQRVIDYTAPTTQTCNVVSVADGSTCKKCGKRVYEMEKMVTDQTVYHKTCFRCNHCHRVLSLANFACMEGHIYCKPHFMEIFMTKGSYDDSFVTGKDMTNWNPAEGIDDYRRVPLELDEEFVPSDLENTPSARMSRSYNEITLVPIQAVRGIYEKLTRDAELAMAAADVSPLKQAQPQPQQKPDDDDPNATTKRHSRRSSVSSTSFKSVEQSVRLTDATGHAGYQEITSCQLPLLNTEQNVQSDLEDAGSESFADSSTGAVISGSTVGSVVPEELPPPQFTKHLLERFRQLEEAQQQQQQLQQQHQKKAALSRAVSAPNTPLHLSTMSALPQDYQTQLSLSPTPPSFLGREFSTSFCDSGNDELATNCSKAAAAAAVYNAETEAASALTEGEQLPLRGQTKALLVQWRSLEVSGSTAPALGRGRSLATASSGDINGSSSYSTRSRSMPRIRDDSVEAGRSCSLTRNSDVVDRTETDDKQSTTSSELPATVSGIRHSDVDNIDNLPPPMLTRYMLAKFQNMSAEAMICSGLQPAQSKKNFKWEVKETASVGYGADGQHKSSAKSTQPRSSAVTVAAETESHAKSQPEVDSETGSRHTSVSELEERKTEGSKMTSTVSTGDSVPSQESIFADDQDFETAAASVNNRNDELPEPGTARNLLAMFQSMQQQNSHH